MLVFFDSEVLNLKCYIGPLILVQAVDQKHSPPKHYHLSEWVYKFRLGLHGEKPRTAAPGQKGDGGSKDLRSSGMS